jgi:glycosyltransferase A (GT-A) superfamily protein (DUF2064 family)
MELRERQLEVADESVTVARARDLLSHARWRAEREFPERWGQHNQVTVNKGIDLGERLRRAKERTIDGERVADTPVAALLPPSAGDYDQTE